MNNQAQQTHHPRPIVNKPALVHKIALINKVLRVLQAGIVKVILINYLIPIHKLKYPRVIIRL